MNTIIKLGKYLLFIPLVGRGLKHFADAKELAGMVPPYLPGGVFWIYLTGICMLLAVVSTIVGKYDKLAFFLAGLMILIFVLTIHLRGLFQGGNPLIMFNMLKDLGLAGACWMYADKYSKDSSIIG
ncbi:MAG: DoxX family protein [Saprospiraceae bacterium]